MSLCDSVSEPRRTRYAAVLRPATVPRTRGIRPLQTSCACEPSDSSDLGCLRCCRLQCRRRRQSGVRLDAAGECASQSML